MKAEQPKVRVGIMTGTDIKVTRHEGPESTFSLDDVTIGKDFHWERRQRLTYGGELELRSNADGTVTAINILPVEDYLKSVISSEMSANAPLELLKAHAVISRSWLLAQIDRDSRNHGIATSKGGQRRNDEEEIVRWYDHEDHVGFDVCADDHCQRYQGLTRVSNPAVEEAVEATRGLILTVDGKICDTRFSKCCGGITEEFEKCWEPRHHSYLEPVADKPDDKSPEPDLSQEEEARRWILSDEPAFCNCNDTELLDSVMNNYDREDPAFYRWTQVYEQHELDRLIGERSGIDFGKILSLQPLERGRSGRITRLRIVGEKRSVTVGKELEIRKWLSVSHLKSSAFVVDRDSEQRWIIRGAGWGHGVGLCQIGAAVMAAKGYDYKAILAHYFHGAELTRKY